MPIPNHLSIPEARDLLRELAKERDMPELASIANAMYRRSHKGSRAPIRSRAVTPIVQARIRRYAQAHPSYSNQEIANTFNVNPGRVSEALEQGHD